MSLQLSAQTSANSSGAITSKAIAFIKLLSSDQKAKAQFSFGDEERYNWHYIPRERKGIPIKELNKQQRKAGLDLLKAALSDSGYTKTTSITQLEIVLKRIENLPQDNTYRDPENYSITIFGEPSKDKIWGWRFEGHHVSFNFSSENNKLISGSPSFLGSNPAVVLSGPEKGLQILKGETDLGFELLHSLDASQKENTKIRDVAPGDIVTSNTRKAMINDPKGILYSELNRAQQKIFMQLLSIYIHRYTRSFASVMMKEIETAGLNNLRFAWAGYEEPGVGHPHYYRIQGPTIIIEYDNTQNNANHVHSVIRDLKFDFGGDELLNHYASSGEK